VAIVERRKEERREERRGEEKRGEERGMGPSPTPGIYKSVFAVLVRLERETRRHALKACGCIGQVV